MKSTEQLLELVPLPMLMSSPCWSRVGSAARYMNFQPCSFFLFIRFLICSLRNFLLQFSSPSVMITTVVSFDPVLERYSML